MTHLEYQIRLIQSSDLFDGEWYSRRYRDVGLLGIPPAEHYLRIGAGLGRDPGPEFNTRFYLQRYPDVAAARMNPLVHYIEHGQRESRATKPHVLGIESLTQEVDVVVPVFNARDDVEKCLESLRHHRDGCRLRVLVINDGSAPETSAWLREYCRGDGMFELIEHETNRGYTCAVNTGLRRSTAEYVVTLNSDAVVTRGWLRGLLRCMASGPKVGIAGPLSNAASWQNVPDLLDGDGAFAVNQLPEGFTPDDMARVVAIASRRKYPRVPFVNGFCFMIRRDVIRSIGLMDEENFPIGYGEENDYCIRAANAGFELAIADDAYVYHAKSRSFGHDRRKELSRAGAEALKRKHSAEHVARLLDRIKNSTALPDIRQHVKAALQQREPVPAGDMFSIRVLFLLPVRGGGGGAHSVIQEAVAMKRLGLQVSVAVRERDVDEFMRQYADISDIRDVIVGFSPDRLLEIADGYDVVVATIFSSMRLVAAVAQACPHILPAYYVQDYEPLFFPEQSDSWKTAKESYELVPGAVLFAKTHWLVNRVREQHGAIAHKVEPSLDHSVYFPRPRTADGRVHLAAMIRPGTPRRGAERTMRVLSRVAAAHPHRVRISLFGCRDDEFSGLTTDFEFTNHGILERPGVAALLASSDVFIDLSDYQAFGRTALEAMACGCTAMVPIHGGTDEYAIDGINSLVVDSFDEDECVARLCDLVGSPEHLSSLRQAAMQTAARYSVHRAAVSELALFSSQLARHRALHPAPVRPRLALIPSARKDGRTPTGSAWVRCLLPYRSEVVRRAWVVSTCPRTRLPEPGSAEVALLQRDAAHIPAGVLDGWLRDWKATGGKLIYEVDDDLLDAEGLRARGYVGDLDQLRETVERLARAADLITVSTHPLAARFSALNPAVRVIENRLDSRLWRLDRPNPAASRPASDPAPVRIVYIGTPTHDADLALVADAIRGIEREFGPRVRVEVIGAHEYSTPLFGHRVGLPRRNDYPAFVDWLFALEGWDIALLPLADDGFNRSKSHLKFLEYAALGLAIVCSDVGSYRDVARDGVNALVVPNETSAWHAAVARLIQDRELRTSLASTAFETVRHGHTIESGAPAYLEILTSACPSAIPTRA